MLTQFAPAKVNLTLRVLRRRDDGYHELDSLVAFADVGDTLTLEPGGEVAIAVRGPTAQAAGPLADNLVAKAARALLERIPGLTPGRFVLDKSLPVAAGLGGGSSDAAAALRLLAQANALSPDDARLHAAAAATGADVPVCLRASACTMRGIGEQLSAPLALPPLAAVLVNPGVAVPTSDVFRALRLSGEPPPPAFSSGMDAADFVRQLAAIPNDLEAPALAIQPVIGDVLAALQTLPGCILARMSGSGATCFGLFESRTAATEAADRLAGLYPRWWVRACALR
ncbi:MAG: 4-(cytidine 5'-diphospho)-2-C-methyl-D-erythritol kinase [Variibacter sp.]|nr:4-(cytidine 5'-diphospho)-2-C-methyl-D-erythritol kinase [Variibacter sp.]